MGQLPKYAISEKEKYKDNGAWFDEWGKFIASQYNQQYPKITNGAFSGYNNQGNVGANGSGFIGGNFDNTPIGQINRWYQYYSAEQPNRDYAWSEADGFGEQYGPTWIRGKKIQQLVDYMRGNALKMLQNLKITTRALSEAATNKRTEKVEKWRFFKAIKPVLDQLGIEDMGVQFSPMGGDEMDFDLPEQVYEYLDKNYKEEMEEYAKIIADDYWSRNDAVTYFSKVFFDAIVGGISATETYARNNRVWTRFYEGDAVIWDNHQDDPLNRDGRYYGLISYLTPTEILDRYSKDQLGTKAYDELIKIANGGNPSNDFLPNIPNSSLRGYIDNGAGITIPILKCYWRASKDTRFKVSEPDKYGNVHVTRKKDDEEGEGDFWLETFYTTTLIGSICQVDYGECFNNVERISDKSKLEPPVKVFTPNVTRGGLESVVKRLYQHQDRKDFLMNEITKYIDKSYGRVLAVNAQMLGDVPFSSVVEDLKRYGITVVNTRSNGEENDQDNKNMPLMEAYDMTLDPNFRFYLELMQQEDAIMEEIAGVSKVALGQQSGYISVNSQQVTIGQNSLQTFPIYMGFLRHICDVLQHVVNQQKNMLADSLSEENQRIPLIGEQGIQYLKEVEDFDLEDFGIFIRVDDVMDETAKAQLSELAVAWSQNPASGITPEDIVKLIGAKTFSQAENILEAAFSRNKRDQAKAQQQQMMMQQLQQAQMMQATQDLEAMKQDNENMRTQAGNETKIAQQQLKSETEIAKQMMQYGAPEQQG